MNMPGLAKVQPLFGARAPSYLYDMNHRAPCLVLSCSMLAACGGADEGGGRKGASENTPPLATPATLPDACEPAASPSRPLLVDDFEDGDELLDTAANLHGAWYVGNDGTGEQLPPATERPAGSLLGAPGAPGSPRRALHTSGGGFEKWGAFVAVKLNASRFAACPYDVSRYAGLKLAIQGSGRLRFNLGTVVTTPVGDYGECETDACSDYGVELELDGDWRDVEVPFEQLTQPDWATPAELDTTRALRLSFWAEKDRFDFWLDDLRFYE